MENRFFVYVVLQLWLPFFMVIIFGEELGAMASSYLVRMEDPHAFVKGILESSQGMLLRQIHIFISVFSFAMMTMIASLLDGLKRIVALLFIGVFVALRFYFYNPLTLSIFALILSCQMVMAKPDQPFFLIRWVPWIGLCFPNLAFQSWKPWLRGLLVFGFSFSIGIFGFWLDCVSSYERVRTEMESWPSKNLDPRIKVLAQNPGIRADWHGVEVTEDYAIVIAEETMRLMAFPLEGGAPIVYKLGERWGPERAAPLDLEIDPKDGLIWLLTEERKLSGFELSDESWTLKEEIRTPAPVAYSYMRLQDEKFVLSPVQVKHNESPVMQVLVGEERNWKKLKVLRNDPSSIKVPIPREIELIPSMNKLVLAPDFGKELYLFDLRTGKAESFIETPTMDGKMRWVPSLERLFIALPNRMEIWAVNPKTKEVDWVIPTQPGVRSMAIDADRNIIVSASVLTGQIWVQDLKTGKIFDQFATVMPMVRELALEETSGQAILTTWAAVYQFPYLDKVER